MNEIKEALKEDWYIQGFNAVPLFLNLPASSGFFMKEDLGYGYTHFIFYYKKGYGEMGYLNPDFKRMWKIIKDKMKNDADYLKKIKKKYEETFNKREPLFQKVEKNNLSKFSDEELLEMLKGCALAEREAVGIAHLLEPVGLGIDEEFKEKLSNYISDKKEFNNVYSTLGNSDVLSFVGQEEKELENIAELKGTELEDALNRHMRKYFWIQNSYAAPKNLEIGFFRERLNNLKPKKQANTRERKTDLLKNYNFDSEIKEMTEIISFTTIWQDERKANTLRIVSYLGKVVDEIAKRTGVKKEALYYLGFTDIFGFESLNDLKNIKNDLEERSEGVIFLMSGDKEIKAVGEEYNELINYRRKLEAELTGGDSEIHGSIANGGTAVGRVVVCKGISSIDNVEEGDILVTSMTRPEYMPAIKKAAAIVTDEGGITCHAAIVARELNMPAVIGTKIATKTLKDGMIVEVKANHGVVKIIKRANLKE